MCPKVSSSSARRRLVCIRAADCRPHRDGHRLPHAHRKANGGQKLPREEFGSGRDARLNEHDLLRQNRHANAKSYDRRAHMVRPQNRDLRHNRALRRRGRRRTTRPDRGGAAASCGALQSRRVQAGPSGRADFAPRMHRRRVGNCAFKILRIGRRQRCCASTKGKRKRR